MDSARWSQVEKLFHESLEQPAAERLVFLRSACDGDKEIIESVISMLAADSRGTSLLDRGLPEIAFRTVGDSTHSIPTQEFGPYRLKKILGEGGMGVVWLAERTDAGNLVAIKFLLHAGLSPARQDRFAREIKTLAKLKHPYIARLYDAGSLADGAPWFVMEYVEGRRFTEYCGQPGLSFEERLRLFRAACEAVQYAHGQEVIHRDLKPSNILVAEDGTPRLLDFGIARELRPLEEAPEFTRPGLRFWSPHYAAPEWRQSGVVGFTTDVYSLGIILYEMLTGQLPENPAQSAASHGQTQETVVYSAKPSFVVDRMAAAGKKNPAAPQISKAEWRDLDVLCLKAMHPDPSQRYQSVEAFIRDMDHFVKSEPLEARPDTVRYRTGKFVRRHRKAVIAVSATVILIIGLVTVFLARLTNARNNALAEASRREQIQRFMLNLFQGGDKESGPAYDLRVATLIDRGAQGAQVLNKEPDVQADLYQTLGSMYQKLGKLDRADELLRLSLHIRSGTTLPNQSGMADNLIAIGLLQSEQGKYKNAEESIRKALATIPAHDPHSKPLLADAEAALGTVMSADGHQAQAVEVLKQAISTMESEQIVPSEELSQALGALADAQMYLGHYDECEALNKRALAIDRQAYGDTHPHVADDLGNLAQVQEIRGYYAEAERYERQALQINEKWYGPDHPEAARKMTTLASTLKQESKFTEAEELLARALSIQQKTYGDKSGKVAYALNALGAVEIHEKKFDEAEKTYHQVIAIYRDAFGDGDYRVGVALGNLASVYAAEKHYTEAEKVLYDVVERFDKSLGADNINTCIAQVRLGRTLLHENKYKEAAEHSRAGYEALNKQTSAQTSYVQGALHDLIMDYKALGQPAEAKEFEARLEATNRAK